MVVVDVSAQPQIAPVVEKTVKKRNGDMVVYKGQIYWYQPNGGSCYLYESKEDLELPFSERVKKAVYKPATTSVSLYVPPQEVVEEPVATQAVAESTEQEVEEEIESEVDEPEEEPEEAPAPTTDRSKPYFFYVGTNVGPSGENVFKEYKFGMSGNLSNRIRAYHTLSPNFSFVLTVRTPSYGVARGLEDFFKKKLGGAMVEESEVYKLKGVQYVRMILQRELGYAMGADGIYSKSTVAPVK